MIERVSSTQLSTFLDCPAKWRFQYCEGNEVQPNEAMSLGTIFHAIMECVVERGIYPTRSMVYAWPGNYEPTSSAMDLYPGGYEEAKKMAKHVGNPRKNEALSHLDWDNAILEQHTTEWGQFLDGDVTASGYIDVLIPSQRIVADWKTRRSFSYAPRSEDFRNNVQLCYYAALAARHYDWPDVTVMHMNVQRPDRAGHSRLMVVEATLSRQFLDEIWNYLDKVVVPQMKAVAAAKQHEAERNQASCFKYGPCMHRSYCNQTDQTNAELFAEMLADLPEEEEETSVLPAKFRARDYYVREITHAEAKAFITEHHYAKGTSNTSVFSHGLFSRHSDDLLGAALWMPPTKVAAKSVHEDWKDVLTLSRLAVHPDVPTNGASYLIGNSIKLIKKEPRWKCLVTWADTRQGHLGQVYRATNWEYLGETRGNPAWVDSEGRQVAVKCAGRSRRKAEMEALGYTNLGRFSKHKFRMLL